MSESDLPPELPSEVSAAKPGHGAPEDDRALEDFLERRSAVSRAYRETAQDVAPPTLDARVLAAAAAPVIRARRLQRWRVPVSLAASFIVVIGVLRLAVQDTPTALEQPLPAVSAAVDTVVTSSLTTTRDARQPAPVAGEAASVTVMADTKAAAAQAQSERVDEDSKKRMAAAQADASRRKAEAEALPNEEPHPSKADVPVLAAAPSTDGALAVAPSLTMLSGSAAASESRSAAPQARTANDQGFAASPPPPQALARVPEAKPRPSSAVAKRADSDAVSRVNSGWRAGQFQGLALGRATLDDVLRRFGPAPVAEPVRSAAPLPDGRTRLRLLEYPNKADTRGPLRLYVDANSQALASVSLTLKPVLPLTMVEQQEGLITPGRVHSADEALCTSDSARPTVEATTFPQYRVYQDQGVYLLLTGPDTVAEISYFDQCQ